MHSLIRLSLGMLGCSLGGLLAFRLIGFHVERKDADQCQGRTPFILPMALKESDPYWPVPRQAPWPIGVNQVGR
jgi:hypothetical protein